MHLERAIIEKHLPGSFGRFRRGTKGKTITIFDGDCRAVGENLEKTWLPLERETHLASHSQIGAACFRVDAMEMKVLRQLVLDVAADEPLTGKFVV